MGMAPAPGNVQVLDEKRVAGFDTAVLAADDAGALGKWLKDHDYDFSPALAEWVKPYLAAGWMITAFKIAKSGDAPTVATSAVRMSFKTDKPFFPYHEPQSQTVPVLSSISRRLLAVFFLSDQKAKGTLGEKRSGVAGRGRVGEPAGSGAARGIAAGPEIACRYAVGIVLADGVRGPFVAAARHGRRILFRVRRAEPEGTRAACSIRVHRLAQLRDVLCIGRVFVRAATRTLASAETWSAKLILCRLTAEDTE